MAYLPGNLKQEQFLDQVIRVNHAGEYGAKNIYAGQMLILKNIEDQQMLKIMADQEAQHLDYFCKEIQKRKIRPSVLLPLWNIMGYALGVGTALLGKNSAMVCTEAIEEVIDEHYQSQLREKSLPLDIAINVEKFRQEELEHHDMAAKNRDELNIGHKILYNAIKVGCRVSIALAKRF